ncbi:MAG: phosphoribosylglycinamide formyltransferase [Tannerella sp.]|jgi:phosphoribosylglycinamide formyltransferase-1|nr:phosphoribosylglycinamide formyltransferase [Tannerella sp.]
MIRLAIFASGSGSNAENIVNYFSSNPDVEISLLISNNPAAGVHKRMNKRGIPSFSYSKNDFDRADPVLEKLAAFHVDWIILAGFLKKIPGKMLQKYPNRIINIHPALLPKYGGKGMYGMHVHEAVVAAKEKETGITVHFINENYDEGPAIFQQSCAVLPADTPDDVAGKIHALEYAYFPKVIEQLILKK